METNLYYVKGKQLDPFHFKLDAYLIVAHTGSQSQTKDAVRDVRLLIEKKSKKNIDLLLMNWGILPIEERWLWKGTIQLNWGI